MNHRWIAAAAVALVLGGGAQADPKGDALLKKTRAAMAKVKTLQADLDLKSGPDQTIKARFEGMKPNYGRLAMKGEPFGEQITISTGKEVFMVMPSEKQYQKIDSATGDRMLELLPGSPIGVFFHPEELGKGLRSRFLGARKVGGKSYQAVQLMSKAPTMTQVLFINASGLIEGAEAVLPGPGKQRISMWLRNVKVNAPLKAEQFAYTPPADFTVPKGPEESLLAVGQLAPDFLLSQPGKPGSDGLYGLEMARKEKKAVLINFWFYN